MCMRPYKIKAVSPNAPRIVYVPCGTCKDCRNAYKSQWQIRLSTELIQRQKDGWNVGFVTLTYDDEHLPYVPDSLLLDEHKGTRVPCFDKQHIRKLILDIRRDLDEFYGAHGLVYMVCGEYGSYTKRPHYHAIFSFPPSVKPFDFWQLLTKYWSYGFLIPKDMEGGYDSKRRYHKPFLVAGSARYAGIYASKYTCKDLDFAKSVNGLIDVKAKDWKRYNCFHVQSRSLGLSWLSAHTDDEKRDFYFKGLSFAGDVHLHQLPVYFRNKLLFSPYYILERKVYKGIKLQSDDLFTQRPDDVLESEGYRVVYRRLVRRKCTEFFYEHRKAIFEKRVDFWKRTISDACSSGWYESKGLDSSLAESFRKFLVGCDVPSLATWIVARHGVPKERQFAVADCDFWFSRYFLENPFGCALGLLMDDIVDFWSSRADFFLSTLSLIYSEESEKEFFLRKLQDKLKGG